MAGDCFGDFAAFAGAGESIALAPPAETGPFGPDRPFRATVRVNRVLTGAGSTKEKRHLELDLAGSAMSYEPGDALGVMPRNAAPLVEALLEALDLSETTRADEAGPPFAEVLATRYEITIPRPRFLRHWARLSGSAELLALTARENTEARRRFLYDNHIVDIVRRYPVRGLDPGLVVAGLHPLEARLYSIASDAVCSETAAITVATTCYDLHGAARRGVFSGHQAPFLAPGAHLPVFVEVNAGFHLPPGDTPLIMIGAGTGVAPFRAFLEARRSRGARAPAWLFFGDRNEATDFLYREEWERALDDGYLTRLDTAFSRDGNEKHYVQHRLIERAAEIRSWLAEGAAIYVCGNASHMAPAVHAALVEIIMGQARMNREEAFARLGALAREHRYCRYVY